MTAYAPSISNEEARLLAHALNDWKAQAQAASPLMSVFSAVIEGLTIEEGDSRGAERAEEREFMRQIIPDAHNAVLARHGLKLENVPLTGRPDGAPQSKIVLVVSDGEAFLKLLKALTPEQAEANDLGENLAYLLRHQISQMQKAVLTPPGLFSPEEHADARLYGAQFTRLGFPIGEQASNTYLWATEGTLAVRLRTAQAGILSDQDAPWGPAKWHTDATAKHYGEMWVRGIEVMQELWEMRDQLGSLATQARRNLEEALPYARAELVRLKVENPENRTDLQGKLAVLAWVQAEIQGLEDQ